MSRSVARLPHRAKSSPWPSARAKGIGTLRAADMTTAVVMDRTSTIGSVTQPTAYPTVRRNIPDLRSSESRDYSRSSAHFNLGLVCAGGSAFRYHWREGRNHRPGVPVFSPLDLRHRGISLLHRQGRSWAEIARFVGQRKLSLTADTYTHVLSDGRELDFAAVLR